MEDSMVFKIESRVRLRRDYSVGLGHDKYNSKIISKGEEGTVKGYLSDSIVIVAMDCYPEDTICPYEDEIEKAES
jgi:hypothetical protein